MVLGSQEISIPRIIITESNLTEKLIKTNYYYFPDPNASRDFI